MTLRSTGGVDIKYHLGHYSWLSPGFNFTLEYEFPMPLVCGQLYRNTPAGALSRYMLYRNTIKFFYTQFN